METKFELFLINRRAQHELLRKENESNVDSLAKMKKSYEEQMNNLVAKEKVTFYFINNYYYSVALLLQSIHSIL